MVSKSKVGCPNHGYWKDQMNWCLNSSHQKNWAEFVENISVCFEVDGVYRLNRLVHEWYTHIGWGLKQSDALELMQSIVPDTPIGVFNVKGRPIYFCNMMLSESEVSDQIDNKQTDDLIF